MTCVDYNISSLTPLVPEYETMLLSFTTILSSLSLAHVPSVSPGYVQLTGDVLSGLKLNISLTAYYNRPVTTAHINHASECEVQSYSAGDPRPLLSLLMSSFLSCSSPLCSPGLRLLSAERS